MGFTTYNYYQNNYFGDSIPESQFEKWNERATDKLRELMGDNLTTSALTTYDTNLQKATCAVADVLYGFDVASTCPTDVKTANVKSMSSGGQSVTFGDNTTVIQKALSSKAEQNKLIFDTASEYLGSTGLLYQGV